jgi:site-specific recombinase XerD
MLLSEAVSLFLRSCRLEKNLSSDTLRAYEIDLRQLVEFGMSLRITDLGTSK